MVTATTHSGYAYDLFEDYRARYYDPTIGRFISEDPSKFRGGVNLYAYAAENPISFRDPLGLCPSNPNPNPPPPDCGAAWAEAGIGTAVTLAEGAGILILGPDILAGLGEGVALEVAVGGPVAGGVAVGHIGEALLPALGVAPALAINGFTNVISGNCY